MFFLGLNFLGADETAVPLSPTLSKENDAIELMNVKADILAVSGNVDKEINETIDDNWDFDKALIATFDNTVQAGNIKWTLDMVEYIAIKRRLYGTYKWITIKVIPIRKLSDLDISDVDITSESLKYEYALVPISGSRIEGEYYRAIVDVTNTDLVLIDKTGIYHTPITDGFCDTVDVHPNSVLELLHNKYPTVVRNTIANYETITVSGCFVPADSNNCTYNDAFGDDFEDDRRRVLYSREVKNFLTNGRMKVLKNVDGQCWLVYVTTPPTDSADNYYKIRRLTFGCTETGDLKNESDLYYAGLLDVPEEWWSSSS